MSWQAEYERKYLEKLRIKWTPDGKRVPRRDPWGDVKINPAGYKVPLVVTGKLLPRKRLSDLHL